MRNPVVARKLKIDGTEKAAWDGDLVDGDDVWLVVFFERPPHRAETGSAVAYALRYYSEHLPLSILVCFDDRGEVLEYQCDAGLPASRSGREIRFTDLDLDLMVGPTLVVRERDRDTFTINRFVMGYAEDVVAAAEAGIALARGLVERRTPPFDGSAAGLLGRVLAERGPV